MTRASGRPWRQRRAAWLGTFHGLGARQLRIEPEVAGLRPGFDILDADDSRRIVKRVMKTMNLASGDDAAAIGRDPLKLICNRLSKFKDNLITPEEAPAQVEAHNRRSQPQRPKVDAHGLRATAPGLCRLSTPPARRERRRFRRPAALAGAGDAAQSDYHTRWAAGSTACSLTNTRTSTAPSSPGSGCSPPGTTSSSRWRTTTSASMAGAAPTSVTSGASRATFPAPRMYRLEENFRSTGHILDAANAVIAQDPARLGKTLFTRKPGGRSASRSSASATPRPRRSASSRNRTPRAPTASRWDDMAVLYRSNALSRSFEEALMRARIPYVLVGDVGFYQRAEIKDALALLRLAATPDDAQADEAFRRVINVPARGFGPRAMEILERRSRPAAGVVAAGGGDRRAAAQGAQRRARLCGCHPRRCARDGGDARRPALAAARRHRLSRHAARQPGGDGRGRLENLQELIAARRRLSHRARAARPRRALHRRSAQKRPPIACADDAAQGQGLGVPARLPAGLGGGDISRRPMATSPRSAGWPMSRSPGAWSA